jgi:hypothetical protein
LEDVSCLIETTGFDGNPVDEFSYKRKSSIETAEGLIMTDQTASFLADDFASIEGTVRASISENERQ